MERATADDDDDDDGDVMLIRTMYKHIRMTNIQLIQLWLLSEPVASFANCSKGAVA